MSAEQTVEAVLSSALESQAFGFSSPAPCLLFKRRSYASGNLLAELLRLASPLSGLDLGAATLLIQTVLDSFWTFFKGKWLIVTLGEQGSLAFSSSSLHGLPVSAPAFNIQAVDTVGAGDAFASALCVAMGQQDVDMKHALMQANACGAMVASELGVLNVLPNREALNAFLSR